MGGVFVEVVVEVNLVMLGDRELSEIWAEGIKRICDVY